MKDNKELITSLFHHLETNEDLHTRKTCVYNLLKYRQSSQPILLGILKIQNGQNLEVLEFFFNHLKLSQRKLNVDICNTDVDISYESAVSIMGYINSENYELTQQLRFAEWILKSSIINEEQKTKIVRIFVSRLGKFRLNSAIFDFGLNHCLAKDNPNPHLIILNAYLGGDMTQKFTSFDVDDDEIARVTTTNHSYLYQAYLATSPECMKALLSCGYAISDLDRAKFEEQPQFKHRVIDCLRVVTPFISLSSPYQLFLMKYLAIAFGCDMPILEAVHCSIGHLGEKSRAISAAIELNKKETGADLIAL